MANACDSIGMAYSFKGSRLSRISGMGESEEEYVYTWVASIFGNRLFGDRSVFIVCHLYGVGLFPYRGKGKRDFCLKKVPLFCSFFEFFSYTI